MAKWEDQKVIKTIKKKNYTIEFIEQDNLEKNPEGLYKLFAELIYKNSMKKAQ